MGGKSSSDTSAADRESEELDKQFRENQKEEAEQRDELDREEMAFLKSNGNLQYLDSPDADFSPTGTQLLTNPGSSSLTDEVNGFSSVSGGNGAMEPGVVN